MMPMFSAVVMMSMRIISGGVISGAYRLTPARMFSFCTAQMRWSRSHCRAVSRNATGTVFASDFLGLPRRAAITRRFLAIIDCSK